MLVRVCLRALAHNYQLKGGAAVKKRICAFLAALLLVGTLFVPARAEELSKEDAVMAEAKSIYRASRRSAGKSSFQGLCGLMVSHQLYNMGIIDSIAVMNGNNQFDHYRSQERTDAGYYISAYSAEEYTLAEALNYLCQNGERDVYNILVGFQWTNTEAGRNFGHACVINAILDGTVYFVESFPTSLGGAEGNVIRCSVETFAEFFRGWTVYEGLIHFGTLAEVSQSHDTSAVLQARFDSVLRSQPMLVGKQDCVALRQISAGERLVADGLFRTRTGETFYQVTENGQIGYVSANAVSYLQAYEGDLTLSEVSLPQSLEEDADGQVYGTVTAAHGEVAAVSLTVTDQSGQIVLRERSQSNQLESLNTELDLSLLVSGRYHLTIAADAASTVYMGGGLKTVYTHKELYDGGLTVGQAPESLSEQQQSIPDGWFCRDGKWYCFKDGSLCTGWLQNLGVWYYLGEDGAALSGWQEIDGQRRYFTATGAVVNGYLVDGQTRYEWSKDGMLIENPTEE